MPRDFVQYFPSEHHFYPPRSSDKDFETKRRDRDDLQHAIETIGYCDAVTNESEMEIHCTVDHRLDNFEGQEVYVWDGRQFKGKIGTVKQMSGGIAKVHFESALFGASAQDVEGKNLVAYVAFIY